MRVKIFESKVKNKTITDPVEILSYTSIIILIYTFVPLFYRKKNLRNFSEENFAIKSVETKH